MPTLSLPTLRCRSQSNLNEHPLQSLALSLLRGVAALEVAAGHLRSEIYPGLRSLADPTFAYQVFAFVTGFAHQAVIVFFLISGWLVGGSLLNRLHQPRALANYAIDRVTRLWTVLLPTLILILLIGMTIGEAHPGQVDASPANNYSALSFIGNLLGVQTILVPNFGGNYALWSLTYETWYYVQFPLLALALFGHGRWRRAACAAAFVLLVIALPGMISTYFILWLLGAAFSRIELHCGNAMRVSLLLLTAVLFSYYRLTGSNNELAPESFVQDLICSILLLLLLASLHQQVDTRLPRFVRASAIANFFSELSFTLYVIHLPLIFLLLHVGAETLGRDQLDPHVTLDYLWYGVILLGLIGAAYVFYLLFERNTFRIRRALKNWLLAPPPKRPVVPVLSPD
ncbi:acyltransferase [Massilia sp. YIM B02443]|uniref:acyltransferase family protein n=1 Tax=Massilia sp. YIM B02443 TaxID=3050127 RepID=UPI0025B7278D|nr:acyltransferase family protein [Massilia sp. YIM B02443]MDN4039548.1 acyltransferase family protein [Massilia sp. YIM B02443]